MFNVTVLSVGVFAVSCMYIHASAAVACAHILSPFENTVIYGRMITCLHFAFGGPFLRGLGKT